MTFHFQPQSLEQTELAASVVESQHLPLVDDSMVSSKSNRTNGLKWLFTVISAIVSGVLFGMVILSFFSASNHDKQKVVEEETRFVNGSNVTDAPFTLAPLALFVLQTGVFSSEQAAQQFQRSLLQQDAHSIDSVYERRADKYHVYAAIAADKQTIESLRDLLQFTPETAIVKPYSLHKLSIERAQASSLLLAESLQSARQVLNPLLQQAAPNPDELNALHRKWSLTAQKAQHAASQLSLQESYHALNRSLNQAYLGWLEWSKNPRDAHNRMVQAAMLDYAVAEQQFITQFKERIK
jgi:stage II sporulation protein B